MRKEHLTLNEKEHSYLTRLTTSGELKARLFKHAMALIWLSDGKPMAEVSRLLDYAYPSVVNLKKNFLRNGLSSLEDKPRSGRPVRFDGAERAKLTALACSQAPEGHARWSLRLLADKAVELDLVAQVSHTQVGLILKKIN
jgi:transposase